MRVTLGCGWGPNRVRLRLCFGQALVPGSDLESPSITRKRVSSLVLCTSRADSSLVDSSLGVTRLEPARVHWRGGSILLASGSNRGQRADTIPLAARVRLDSLGSRLEQGSMSGLESLGTDVAYRSNHRNL